ncbi:MAG: NAD(P)-dependent oxidoreductase, partial [Thaumarchaeota archaeon]
MKVFVTGNLGYVGTVLENLLEEENFEIIGCDIGYFPKSLVNSQNYLDNKNYLKKDIRNITLDDLEGIDAICHLAGLSNDPMGEINEDLTYTINHKATIELAKTAKKAGVKRFIFSSSCSSYGANQDFVNEKSDVSPLTAYAKSKVLAENDLL